MRFNQPVLKISNMISCAVRELLVPGVFLGFKALAETRVVVVAFN